MKLPLTKPSPPRLSEAAEQLRGIENRGIYSNYGPVNTAFEQDLITQVFNGKGYCTTVCNATLGLMLAVRAVIANPQNNARRYALMPSFTFAAAAHAAIWCGLTPLFCDIDPDNWAADASAEEEMLRLYGDDIAVVMPYATFGYDIDLDRYAALSRRYGIPVVVDAAASLGTLSANGDGFGAGSTVPVVFSMHATKPFATGEGGLIYSADQALIQKIKTMSNFGFGEPRTATMPGLNAKMTEVSALLGQMRLQDYVPIMNRRQELVNLYRQTIPELTFQSATPARQAHQFASALLPKTCAAKRDVIQRELAETGTGCGAYFSPHLAQQPYFQETCMAGGLAVADDVASRIISLPLYDTMQDAEVAYVAAAVRHCLRLAAPAQYSSNANQNWPNLLAAD